MAATHPSSTGWRLALVALGWLAGVALQLQQARLPAPPVDAGLGAAAGLALALAAWVGLRSARAARPAPTPDGEPAAPARTQAPPPGVAGWRVALLLALAAGLGAVAVGDLRARARLAQRLPAALEGQPLWVQGRVTEMPQAAPGGWRFGFEVESAAWRPPRPGPAGGAAAPDAHPPAGTARPAAVPAGDEPPPPPLPAGTRLALGWYDSAPDEPDALAARVDLRAGQRWALPLRLKRPHGTLNPEGYDVELSWFEQGIAALGSVRQGRADPPPQALPAAGGLWVERARQAIRDAIVRQVPDARVAGVLAALVVGDQGAIDREDWELFRQTGIAHLVAISGVHITMLAWLAARAVGWAWRASPALMHRLPAPEAGRWAGVLLAGAYALLAGWGVPAQRTVWMLATVQLLRSGARQWPWPLVLLAAAVVVTLADPWALLQAGFWLSFAAVGLLMASGRPVQSAHPSAAGPLAALRRVAAEHGRAQAVAAVGLAPLSLLFFQQLSVVGLLANLVAIPLVTLLVTPLALLGVLLPPLWTLAAALVQGGVQLLALLAGWPWAVWTAGAAPAWAVAAAALGAWLAVAPLPARLRALALPLMLPLLLPAPVRPAPGHFELLVADVGQGTAVLVRTAAHLLVYDAGPAYGRDSDAGQRVLLPLLRARGERAIDLLMLSHRDTDHVGGAARLIAGLPVRALSSSLAADHPLRQRGLPHSACSAGQRWQWDGVQFELLHPLAEDLARPLRPNELSCVLRVRDAAGRSALLTGDIEAAQESALVQRLGAALASTVLLVPHHGSRTSSTPRFLAAVQPQVAVAQAGHLNRFGHPAPDVVARHGASGINLVQTSRCGAWMWRDGAFQCTRSMRQRHWHAVDPVPPAGPLPAGGAVVAIPPVQPGPRPLPADTTER